MLLASGGYSEYVSPATSRSPAPTANVISVSRGLRLTMRCGGAAKVVVVPESSVMESGNGVGCWAAHAGAMAWGSNNASVPSAAKRVRRDILSIDLTLLGSSYQR